MKRKQFIFNIVIFIFIFVLSTVHSFSYTIYKWKDNKGAVHYTDKKPERSVDVIEIIRTKNRQHTPIDEIVIIEEDIDENVAAVEEEILQEEIRQYWRNLALNIEQKKERTLEEIYVTEKKIDILKSNIDYYLINGYKADLMILDLRYLEGSLPPLFERLEIIGAEKEQLRIDARKQGIPPGYLRP